MPNGCVVYASGKRVAITPRVAKTRKRTKYWLLLIEDMGELVHECYLGILGAFTIKSRALSPLI